MTKIYYDTEFLEDGHTVDLISIGMVSEAGDEYYAVVDSRTTIDNAIEHTWLRENVIPLLPITLPRGRGEWTWDGDHPDFVHVKIRRRIAKEVRAFILSHSDPQLWAWYGAYDHVVLCQLFGAMIDLPDGIPMWTNDLKQECVRLGDPQMVEQETGHHNALADARHNLQMALALDALDRATVQTLISIRPDRIPPRPGGRL